MAKPKMPKITEPDTGLVHYASDDLSGNVTLCGLTDFLGDTPGKATKKPLTCNGCKSIKKYCDDHAA